MMATLSLNSDEFESGLSGAEDKAGSFGSKLSKGVGTAAKVGAAAFTAIGVAAVGASTAFVKGANDVAQYGDTIDKESQKMGISAEAYQEWDAILQHSGTSISALGRSMTTLSKAAEKGDESFQKLGLSQADVASMSKEELFAKTIEGLQGMEEGTERTVLAQKLLGGSARQLGALLNTSAEDTEAMRQRVHELGGVMSDEAVKSAAAYQDSLQDMQTAFSGLSRNMLSEFMPSITSVMDGLTGLFSGDTEGGLQLINQGISDFMTNMSEALPQVVEVGSTIINGLLSAIIENLPQIVQSGTELIIQLVVGVVQAIPKLVAQVPAIISAVMAAFKGMDGSFIQQGINYITKMANGFLNALPSIITSVGTIITNLLNRLYSSYPQLMQKGFDLISNLAKGLMNNLPAIITAITQVISRLIATIASNLPAILQKGIEIIAKIAAGIIQAIPKVVAAIPQVIAGIVKGFTSHNWGDIGGNIISGIATGIRNGVGSIIDAAKNAASNALNAAKRFLGIASPSKVMRDQVGRWIPEGIAEGISNNMGVIADAMEDVADIGSYSIGTTYSGRHSPVNERNGLAESIESLDRGLTDKIIEALSYMRFEIDNREFARLVRNVRTT